MALESVAGAFTGLTVLVGLAFRERIVTRIAALDAPGDADDIGPTDLR